MTLSISLVIGQTISEFGLWSKEENFFFHQERLLVLSCCCLWTKLNWILSQCYNWAKTDVYTFVMFLVVDEPWPLIFQRSSMALIIKLHALLCLLYYYCLYRYYIEGLLQKKLMGEGAAGRSELSQSCSHGGLEPTATLVKSYTCFSWTNNVLSLLNFKFPNYICSLSFSVQVTMDIERFWWEMLRGSRPPQYTNPVRSLCRCCYMRADHCCIVAKGYSLYTLMTDLWVWTYMIKTYLHHLRSSWWVLCVLFRTCYTITWQCE